MRLAPISFCARCGRKYRFDGGACQCVESSEARKREAFGQRAKIADANVTRQPRVFKRGSIRAWRAG
jgi:hypothetical protein